MRIIGGKYRGKKLFSPRSENVRPTSDMTREALFNIMRNRLGQDFSSLKLIDIFSGSGAFGLEALSQGFAKVTLVDIDINDLQKNVKLRKHWKTVRLPEVLLMHRSLPLPIKLWKPSSPEQSNALW